MKGTVIDPAVRIKNLRKAYQDVVAVDGLDLEVHPGECFGLLGPNGAGKTTTIEICEGLNTADSGDVEVLGLYWHSHAKEIRQRLGIQLQETQLSEKLSVYETIRLFRSFFRQGPRPDDLIALVQLEEKRDVWVTHLSGGQKQRLALACALAGDPELLFLDEPTTGLDPQARRQLWELVDRFKEQRRTVLLTTHYMDEAQRLCGRIAIMDHGRIIAQGTPAELIASLGAEQLIAFVPGCGPTGLNLGRLNAIDGVRHVRTDNGTVEMRVDELHRSVPALLAELSRQSIPITQLETRSATLEDVFVTLTGRHLRDD
jgi:ABC-2 type transport system ATP-binding protein